MIQGTLKKPFIFFFFYFTSNDLWLHKENDVTIKTLFYQFTQRKIPWIVLLKNALQASHDATP